MVVDKIGYLWVFWAVLEAVQQSSQSIITYCSLLRPLKWNEMKKNKTKQDIQIASLLSWRRREALMMALGLPLDARYPSFSLDFASCLLILAPGLQFGSVRFSSIQVRHQCASMPIIQKPSFREAQLPWTPALHPRTLESSSPWGKRSRLWAGHFKLPTGTDHSCTGLSSVKLLGFSFFQSFSLLFLD